MLQPSMDRSTQTFFISGCLGVGGVFLGYFRSDRPWRWGFASLLVLPIGDLAWAIHDPSLKILTGGHVLPYLAARAPQFLVQALPVLIGAYLGSYLKTAYEPN